MRYIDIKDIVIGTADTLDLVPGDVVYDLLGGDLPGITDQDYLIGIKVKRITCVTHAYIPGGWDSPYAPYSKRHVCSILVDDVAAFFFIYEGGTGSYTYVLDWALIETFIYLIKQWLRVEEISDNSLVSCVAWDEVVPQLTSCMGVSIECGAGPEGNSND
jgi:hypothetical protein